jgi:hypothetical protein
MEGAMKVKQALYSGVAVAALALVAPTAMAQTVAVKAADIGGVVTGASGPEAGVWVIAETTDLPTKFARIVVTDDQGRYLIPDLPKANYTIWVRGYGLIDSPKVQAAPGKLVNLAATPAPTEAAAVLVFDAPDPGQEPVPRHWRQGQWHPRVHEVAELLDRHREEFLPVVPCAG